MLISEFKTKKKEVGSFKHRESFETLDEGLEWARELAFRIADKSDRWTDEDLVMNHFEVNLFNCEIVVVKYKI